MTAAFTNTKTKKKKTTNKLTGQENISLYKQSKEEPPNNLHKVIIL